MPFFQIEIPRRLPDNKGKTGRKSEKCTEFFCYEISNGDFHDLRFAYDAAGGTLRVILRGAVDQILPPGNKYFSL